MRQFVADASHELRTPLATIVGYTELARTRPDAEATATALDKVEEEAGRMTTLVEDLLLLARLDAGRPLAREPVDLTRLLRRGGLGRPGAGPRPPLAAGAARQAVEVTGDEQGLHQVVTNLLTNARKHTPAGTPSPSPSPGRVRRPRRRAGLPAGPVATRVRALRPRRRRAATAPAAPGSAWPS